MTRSAANSRTADGDVSARPTRDNSVFLRGRLAAAPEEKDLPSGDVLMLFRLTVIRPAGERGHVDSIECSSVKPRVQRSLRRAEPGDELEVTGSLRRRFWRGPAGPASRYAVDVESIKVNRAGRRGGASRAQTPASA